MSTIERTARVGAALLVIAACAPRPATGTAAGGECPARQGTGEVRTFVVAAPAGAATLGAQPFVATCRLPASALAGLAAGAPEAAVLYLEGVRPPADRAVTVDVYLGSDGSPAGSFTLLPQRGGVGRVPVLLGHALGAALRGGTELSVTLRAVDPANEAAPPPPVDFERMVIELR